MKVAAVDLGASSGRVAVVDLDTFSVDVVHRFANAPVEVHGTLRWNWTRLMDEVQRGLHAAGPVASIGVDTWGVDYGVVDDDGDLVAPPFSYRDTRTSCWREVVDRIGPDVVYGTTGIQLMAINTLCQLAVHDREELRRARHLLMLPELVVHGLCGAATGERTSAGTTQLVDVRTGDWSAALLDAIDVDPSLLPPIGKATALVGTWNSIPVHLVGGHDTASAVAALPDPAPGAVFVSSGTWALVGAERQEADTSDAAMRANFSNEPSVFDGYRFLRNVMGLWMLDECVRAWDADLAALLDAAGTLPDGGPTVDATDERFLAPRDMEAEVRRAAGLPSGGDRATVVRCVLDSLAATIARIVEQLAGFVGPATEIHVIGGGARNALLNRLLEEATGLPMCVGPAEATALGNAIVQGIALGRFDDLASARRELASV